MDFHQLGIFIDIVNIWFRIANGQISSKLLKVICQKHPYFCFADNNLSSCIDVKGVWFGIAYWQISSMFDRVICPRHDNGGVL